MANDDSDPAASGTEPAQGLYGLAQDLTGLFGDRAEEGASRASSAGTTNAAPDHGQPVDASPALSPSGRVVLTSPWERMLVLLAALDTTLNAIASGHGDAREVTDLARRVQSLCTMDADAALASLILLRTKEYSVRHSLRVALLVELLLRRARADETFRASAVCAALTMNVGMLEMQNLLYMQREPLTDEQRAQIKLHQERGVELLRAAGATDAAWIDYVASHHEHADGTGYPHGLRAPKIGLAVQTIAISDRYCAMVSERGYRPGARADRALNLLLDRLGGTISVQLGKLLKSEVGDHPPGCAVKLANDEIGVVYRRLREPGARVVKALIASTGLRHEVGPRRLTTNPRFAIVDVLTPDDNGVQIDPTQIWDAAADPEIAGAALAA